MAWMGRTTPVAPQIAAPAALSTLARPRVFICCSSAHPIPHFSTQGGTVMVDVARCEGQTESLEVQKLKVSSCKNLGEQTAKFSSMMALAATTLVAATCVNEAYSLEIDAGASFERTCAGCHAGGGNILQPAATLRKEDLEKNGLLAVDDIYTITYFGKNRMPGYGEKCAPRGQCTFGPRLSEENIRALAEFVKLKAGQGWSK